MSGREPAPALRVLVDATAIPANRGGVGRYVDSVIPLLARDGIDVVVVCQQRDRTYFEASGVGSVVTAPAWAERTALRFVWEQTGLVRLARAAGAAVIHSPHYTFPVFTRAARVVTVHDLTFFTDPAVHGRVKRLFFRGWIRAAALAHVTVVTPSVATANEFTRITRARSARVFAAPLGYDQNVFHLPTADDIAAFQKTLDPQPVSWIAFLGTLEPRKNVSALVRGYVEAVSAHAPADRPALLLAGGPGWDSSVADTVAAAVASGFDVRTLGYLPLDDLRSLLGGSLLTAYPSLGEGFGLPVLEAMASGSCVLTTRRLSLPEVGGDAVSYCDVDPGSIGRALAALLDDPAERRRLARAGAARAEGFTWQACADRHAVAYRAAGHPSTQLTTEKKGPR
ncbi:glycosyltransferase family 4 protein [Subtercola vilae]|uniref:glycosyltransferase family 4 protein n=1 Tax=Subtercola vilae TaxID=2056433 RepID=UPI001F1F759E|nr:glycosyltransferase family 1 protein [Subtercola vilae]